MRRFRVRLKAKEIKAFRELLLAKQDGRCKICRILIHDGGCLDHCHVTGHIRSVLCRNCNGIEGKIFNLVRRAKRHMTEIQWIETLVRYWSETIENPSGVFHPTHKTDDEKRLLRNKRARAKRKK